MEVDGIHNEFLSEDELEEGQIEPSSLSNNNVTILNEVGQVQGHHHDEIVNKIPGWPVPDESEPSHGRGMQKLGQSVALLQNFLIKKGLTSKEDLAELMEGKIEQIPSKRTETNTGKN